MDLEWIEVAARAIISVIPYASKVLNVTKETLDTTKTGMELLESAKQLVEKDSTEHPEQTVDRVHAMADMTRSLGPLAFAEVIFYAVKTCAFLLLFKYLIDFATRREAKRIAKEMIAHEQKKQ